MECQVSLPGTLAVDKLENKVVYSLFYLVRTLFISALMTIQGKHLQTNGLY